MRIEHLALNLDDAPAVVAWYSRHLAMPIQHEVRSPIYVAFLGEPPVLLEIYCNPMQPRLAPAAWDPLTLHLAVSSNDLIGDQARLIAAGAAHHEGRADADGYGLVFLRCPWGLPLQLCRRRLPLSA